MLFERYTDESAFDAHLASPHFRTWLRGQVLPFPADRIRFDLVPLEDWSRGLDGLVAGGEAGLP